MKKFLRLLIPIILAISIILCMAWYLFIYDRPFTRDILLTFARISEDYGKHNMATWFYNQAYYQAGNNDAVAIELAEQYKTVGNFTKAEFTLTNAIANGGGIELYIALCNTYVQQDKLLDAVNMLNNIANPQIKEEIDKLRPKAPTSFPNPGFYNQYITVTLSGIDGTLYFSNDGQYPSTANNPYQDPIVLGDGETSIYALTVAENGLVSPLSIFGYTIGGVITEMEFADPYVEVAVRELLNVSEDKLLYTNDLWTIKSFTMPAAATNYADLKHMIFLESLTIEGSSSGQLSYLSALTHLNNLEITGVDVSVEELAVIASLPELKTLKLQKCGLYNISALDKATSLTVLDLSENTIRNIESLSGLNKLQELSLRHNALEDLTPLSSLLTLTKLDVAQNNKLTSLAPISGLSSLIWLAANNCNINNLGEIGKLTALSYLNVSTNKLTDISALAACKAITELNISSNSITDITKLSALTKMQHFDFSYNKVTKLPAFPKSCDLAVITGSNNSISSLDRLAGLEKLNIVNMDYNTKISSVKPLASCPLLVEVNVYATKVKDVTALTDQSIVVNYKPV
ncbi:MAG: leucine-rich repeat domain-containing protein [Oscillospiraceae bacterium]|nr:leucine-rich repeat domain-containing protein [Oscillospiraceae bacterium]